LVERTLFRFGKLLTLTQKGQLCERSAAAFESPARRLHSWTTNRYVTSLFTKYTHSLHSSENNEPTKFLNAAKAK